MAIDRTGGIHLAFFNSRLGALVYAFAPSSTAAFTAVVVDTMDNVGTWTDISVDHWGNPFIVYGFQDRLGNFDGIRMAYRSSVGPHASTAGGAATSGTRADLHFSRQNSCPFTGGDIGGWEAVSMPSPFRVSHDRLNIESWPPTRVGQNVDPAVAVDAAQWGAAGTQWSAAIGYASDVFRIGYFFRPGFAGDGSGMTAATTP